MAGLYCGGLDVDYSLSGEIRHAKFNDKDISNKKLAGYMDEIYSREDYMDRNPFPFHAFSYKLQDEGLLDLSKY